MKFFKYISKTWFTQLFTCDQMMLSRNDAIKKSIAYMFPDCVWLYASESIIESSSLKESLKVV